MAMRAWVVIPDEGLAIDGRKFRGGPREVTDTGWFRLLKAAGATEITEKEFNGLKAMETRDAAQHAPGRQVQAASRKRGAPARRSP